MSGEPPADKRPSKVRWQCGIAGCSHETAQGASFHAYSVAEGMPVFAMSSGQASSS
jgi:hypothetical protein